MPRRRSSRTGTTTTADAAVDCGRARHTVRRYSAYRAQVNATALPDEPDLESFVIDALDRLPEAFRSQLGSVAIVIEEEPTPDQLETVGAPGLFGLYQGVPRTHYAADGAPLASKITIFRGPHLRAHGRGPRLAEAVAETVYHEIAHHFGISDGRLHELRHGVAGQR